MAEDTEKLAKASKELLTDPAFQASILQLRKQWFAELMNCKPDAIPELVYKLRALEAVPLELAVLVNNHKMAQKNVA